MYTSCVHWAGSCCCVHVAWRKYSHHFRAPCRGPRAQTVRGRPMKDQYDFSKGRRGRVTPPEPEPEGKVRITIRLDQDIVDRFLQIAEASGGGPGYQTLINAALREYLDGKAPPVRRHPAAHHPGRTEFHRGLTARVESPRQITRPQPVRVNREPVAPRRTSGYRPLTPQDCASSGASPQKQLHEYPPTDSNPRAGLPSGHPRNAIPE